MRALWYAGRQPMHVASRYSWLLALSVLMLTLAQPAALAAQEQRPSPFLVDPWLDGTLMALGLTLWVVPSVVADDSVRPPCDPCDPAQLNVLDRSVVGWSNHGADVAGDVLVIALPAVAAVGTLADLRGWGWRGVAEDTTLIAESMILAGALQQVVRFAVRRPRPFMYQADARPDIRDEGSASLSFFSGHTASTFAAAAAFAYVYGARRPQSRLRPLVWAAALLAAAVVPAMRVSAGEHFWTDVLVGAVVGTGSGLLVPLLHRRRDDAEPHLRIGLSSASLEARF